MSLIFGIILGLVVLCILVVLHELGHAIVARRNGVVVEEFGIGFPPRAWKKKLKNGVLFTLNWLPLGGFVRLKGEYDSAKNKGDYGAANYWVKTKILLAGVVINWLAAAAIFTVLAVFGLPKIIDNQFMVASDAVVTAQPVELSAVAADSPAQAAGLQERDKIISIAGEPVDSSTELSHLTEQHKGESVEIEYQRAGEVQTATAQLRGDNDGGFLGVSSMQQTTIRASWSAPLVGLGTTAQFTWLTLEGIGSVFGNLVSGLVQMLSFNQATRETGQAALTTVSNNVAGPIGILGVIFPAAGEAGLLQVLLLTAIISLTLAVMNILPIPALDGGRWFVMTIFKLLKKPLTKEREETIQSIGFVVLIGLIILVTIGDVGKLF